MSRFKRTVQAMAKNAPASSEKIFALKLAEN